MGWFWQSSTSSPNAASGAPSSPPQQQQTTTPPPATVSRTANQTPDQIEVQKFLEQFMEQNQTERSPAPPPPPSPPAQQTPTTTSTSSSLSSWLPWASKSNPDQPPQTSSLEAPPPLPPKGRSAISRQMSEHSLPTTMSCRDAFDYAWHCHTPGSQWNAVYRYGGVRNCTELWDDFWFCMRTKNYSAENRAEAIKEHYRAKEEAKYGGGRPSSEDVWESREERVPVGTAFKAEFAPPVVDDKQYRINEMERRRRIRRELGIEEGEDEGNNGNEKK